jgi:hypothetical protein
MVIGCIVAVNILIRESTAIGQNLIVVAHIDLVNGKHPAKETIGFKVVGDNFSKK